MFAKIETQNPNSLRTMCALLLADVKICCGSPFPF